MFRYHFSDCKQNMCWPDCEDALADLHLCFTYDNKNGFSPRQCGMCEKQNLRSACAYAQSDHSHCSSFEYYMSVKPLTEHHFEFLSFKGGCIGLSDSTLIKMPNGWKSHVAAHFLVTVLVYNNGQQCKEATVGGLSLDYSERRQGHGSV